MLAFLALLVSVNLFSNSNFTSAQQTPNPAPQNSNMVSGHVSDDQHNSIAEIRVELLNEIDTVLQTVKTNASGLFVFRRLSDGTFQVRVQGSDKGYVMQTKRVELARPFRFGATSEEVDFVLHRRQNTDPTTNQVVFVQEVPEQARKLYERAAQILQQPVKRAEGLATLQSALEIYPQYFDALDLMGNEQVKQHQYDAAIAFLTKAVDVNAKSYSSWFALGVAQYNLKQPPLAVESLRRAVGLKQNSVNANLWLGIALRQTGPLDDAERYLKQADQLAASKLPDAHWQLALLYNQLKRFGEAANQLEMFLKVQPNSKDSENIKKLIQRFREQAGQTSKSP